MQQKTASVRELQHNLSSLMEMAKTTPVIITKHGREEILLLNPENFKLTPIKREKIKNADIMDSKFIGFHKGNKNYQNKSSAEIATNLRKQAFYGK